MNDELKAEVKAATLELAEKVAAESVETIFTLMELVIKDSENKFDDMVLPALPLLKTKVLALVAKIDGK
jgi:ribosomal protein L1